MSCVSTYLMFALLTWMQPPTEEQALPKYDAAPPPEVVPDPSAPEPPAPLTPERARSFRKAGIGLTIAGAILVPIGVVGLGFAINGMIARQQVDYAPGYLERERQARLRQAIGMGVGYPCIAIGVAFLTVGAAMRKQVRAASKVQVAISPTWLWGGGGVAVGGRF